MKLSIMPIDNAVYIDGVEYIVEVKTPPEDIHALQWNAGASLEPGDDRGDIEYRFDESGNKKPNKSITKLPTWTKKYITAWEKAEKEYKEGVEIQAKKLAERDSVTDPITLIKTDLEKLTNEVQKLKK